MNKEIKLRDNRLKEKYTIDDHYLNGYARVCGWKATLVYNSLCRHANKDQYSFPSVEKMAEQHNVSERTIKRGINILEKHNIISVQRKERKAQGIWKNNGYTLIDKSEWKRIAKPKKTRKNISPGVSGTLGKNISPGVSGTPDQGSQGPLEGVKEFKELNIKNAKQSFAFSLKGEIEKMKTDKKKHVQLIGEYLEEKEIPIESKEQLQVAIKRHARAAVSLSKFSNNRIGWATKVAMKEYPEYTLETLVKILTR